MNRLITTLILLIAIFHFSCSRKSVSVQYYVLEAPAPAPGDDRDAPVINGSCEIEPVDIAPVYSSNRIAHRMRSHEIAYYGYRQWAIQPSASFTRMATRYFQDRRLFESVESRFWKERPDYRLVTRVDRLETAETDGGFTANIDLRLVLINAHTGQAVAAHGARLQRTLEKKSVNSFAAAVSEMFYNELSVFEEKIRKKFLTVSTETESEK